MSTTKKQKSRRDFITEGAKAGALFYLLGNPVISTAKTLLKETDRSSSRQGEKTLLILGGTSFLGPQQIAFALEKGFSISIFTRGKTKPTTNKEVFKHVEHLIGDRENNLESLKGRKWDAVIDNSGYKVKWTKETANLLKDTTGLYLYTSSTGVYYPYLGSDITEKTKLVLSVPPNINEEQKMEYDYGVMKANSEIEVKKAFGEDRSIIVRPTYMMGPGDRTDRFTYWPVRLQKGGEVLIPGKPNDPVQYIDVRDVARWMIDLVDKKVTGTYNAVGPASETGMNEFVFGVHAAFSSAVSYTNIPDYNFLLDHNIPYAIPWIMPIGDNYGTARVSNALALKNGLTLTPLANSCQDIVEWWYSETVSDERREKLVSAPGSLMKREKEILASWNKYNQ